MIDRDELIARGMALPARPIAIEAYWDGDTEGWWLGLGAVLEGDVTHRIAALREGAEARLAAEVGRELAAHYGVPFWFASPDQPEDDAARWLQRNDAVPCTTCGLLLVQRDGCPWKGVCYPCHRAARS